MYPFDYGIPTPLFRTFGFHRGHIALVNFMGNVQHVVLEIRPLDRKGLTDPQSRCCEKQSFRGGAQRKPHCSF